jgi:hypothetical protein
MQLVNISTQTMDSQFQQQSTPLAKMTKSEQLPNPSTISLHCTRSLMTDNQQYRNISSFGMMTRRKAAILHSLPKLKELEVNSQQTRGLGYVNGPKFLPQEKPIVEGMSLIKRHNKHAMPITNSNLNLNGRGQVHNASLLYVCVGSLCIIIFLGFCACMLLHRFFEIKRR